MKKRKQHYDPGYWSGIDCSLLSKMFHFHETNVRLKLSTKIDTSDFMLALIIYDSLTN